jgi:hypothetical protein
VCWHEDLDQRPRSGGVEAHPPIAARRNVTDAVLGKENIDTISLCLQLRLKLMRFQSDQFSNLQFLTYYFKLVIDNFFHFYREGAPKKDRQKESGPQYLREATSNLKGLRGALPKGYVSSMQNFTFWNWGNIQVARVNKK